MRAARAAGLRLLVMGLAAACATGHNVERVPLRVRFEGLYGHRLDVKDPPNPPRNPQWENARLDIFLRVDRYLEAHPDLPPAIATALTRHDLITGLTQEQVQLLWGPPDRIRHLAPRHDAAYDELWSYDLPYAHGIGNGSCRLFFKTGVLIRLVAPST